MSSKRLRTSINKKPAIFAGVAVVLCTFFIFWFSFSNDNFAIRMIIVAFCAVFDALAIILLISQTLVWVEIKDGYIHSWVMFFHKKVQIEKIKYIVYKDNAYLLYLKNEKKFCSINSYDQAARNMLLLLEKNGAKYIEK